MNLNDKTNTELLKLRKEYSDEFERVRIEVIKTYDQWIKIEQDYISIDKEIKKRKIEN